MRALIAVLTKGFLGDGIRFFGGAPAAGTAFGIVFDSGLIGDCAGTVPSRCNFSASARVV